MRSIRVRPDLVQRVKLSVKGNGFFRQKDLVEAVGLADSTVRNFLGGKPVDYATFEEICRKLNLEWKDFADLGEVAKFDHELEAVVTLSESELSSKPIVLDQSQPSHPVADKIENTLETPHKIEPISFLEYFSKAIDQLKSKELDVRIGAISTLGTLSEYSPPAEHWKVMEYLATFIRTNAPRKEEEEREEERSLNISSDIQAALTVIGGRDWNLPILPIDLSNTDLRGANLNRANLRGANFNGSNLQQVTLIAANLQRAKLKKVNLQRAIMHKAILQRANLEKAELQEADLDMTDLQEADLLFTNLQGVRMRSAYLERAKLIKVDLQGAFLWDNDWQGVIFSGVDLRGADIRRAKNLDSEEIAQAHGNSTTVLPDDVERPAHWM